MCADPVAQTKDTQHKFINVRLALHRHGHLVTDYQFRFHATMSMGALAIITHHSTGTISFVSVQRCQWEHWQSSLITVQVLSVSFPCNDVNGSTGNHHSSQYRYYQFRFRATMSMGPLAIITHHSTGTISFVSVQRCQWDHWQSSLITVQVLSVSFPCNDVNGSTGNHHSSQYRYYQFRFRATMSMGALAIITHHSTGTISFVSVQRCQWEHWQSSLITVQVLSVSFPCNDVNGTTGNHHSSQYRYYQFRFRATMSMGPLAIITHHSTGTISFVSVQRWQWDHWQSSLITVQVLSVSFPCNDVNGSTGNHHSSQYRYYQFRFRATMSMGALAIITHHSTGTILDEHKPLV